jgi:Adenylate and Guanylate cyclase catalytic domain
MGDGVLGYFGYPQAHEHDAERAVRAGLAIVAAAPKLETVASATLHVRVGIATGIVVVGDLLGSGEAQEPVHHSVPLRDAAGRASRVCQRRGMLHGKLAEMVAFIRLAAPCDGVVQVPPEYVTEALSLLMVVDPPISEQMIEAKEEVVKNYRAKLGLAKWCQLYAVEVSEANTIGKLMLGLGR